MGTNWVIGVILLIGTLLLIFTGYLLPWDQLVYWSISVGTNMARATQVLGHEWPFALLDKYHDIFFLLLCGSKVGPAALLRFYMLHVILLPLVIMVFAVVHSKAPQYFLWLQELLVYFDPWLAGVVLPTLILLGLMAIPYVDIYNPVLGQYRLSERKIASVEWIFFEGGEPFLCRPSSELVQYPYEDLRSPSRVHIDCYGHVQLCQGLSMGNMWR